MMVPECGTPGPSQCLHSLYGLTLSSNYPFVNRFSPGAGTPDLFFRMVRDPYRQGSWENTDPIYRTETLTKGEPLISIYKPEGCLVIHHATVCDFYLFQDRIEAHLLDPACEFLVEIILLGEVLAVWLELHEIPAIHASAVVTEGGAIAFLSTNKGGKSTLAAFLAQQGYPLLTDDILPVECANGHFFGRPGYPGMRMWPDEAGFFLGGYEDLEIVHPAFQKRRVPVGPGGIGRFCNEKQPLKAFYLPRRVEGISGVTIGGFPRRTRSWRWSGTPSRQRSWRRWDSGLKG
jgi:hypothetical protein